MGLPQVEGALLDGQPPGHFAHRREEREAPVRALDGLVGEGDRVGLAEGVGQIGHGGEVEEREEDLVGAKPAVLDRDRLLHLEDEIGLRPHQGGGAQDGADRGVLLVADPAPDTGSRLHEHPVAVPHEGLGAGGGEGDPLLARLDLARDSDDHATVSW